VGKVRRSARLMNEMLQALWSLGQLRAAGLRGEKTPIAPVLAEVVDELTAAAHAAGARIEIEPFDDGRTVACSAGTLALVLSNLLQNAIKYGVGSDSHRIAVRVGGDDERVRLEVEDSGPGVRPDMQERIFELYVRADPTSSAPGLGLGLATLKHLVDMQGGAIGVRPGESKGACFWVQLDAAQARS
jgi:signal transduction histidine kinase